MTVTISFITPGSLGSGASGVSTIRAQERLTVGATTTNTTKTGESVIIGNGELTMIAAAYGTTPDANAVTDGTPPGYLRGYAHCAEGTVGVPLCPGSGYKINVKAVP